MIGQNRQAAFQQAKADHDYIAQERLARGEHASSRATIHQLTQEVHHVVTEPHGRGHENAGAR